MFADQVFDLGLRRVIQRIVRGTHVGELRVPAALDHDTAGQQRILRRHRTIRAVGMPQPVAKIEHAPPIVARQRLVVLVEVRRILHVERQPALGCGCDMTAGR